MRYLEGRIHGFVVIRDLNDKLPASDTSIQSAHGNHVIDELSFRFKDGSCIGKALQFSAPQVSASQVSFRTQTTGIRGRRRYVYEHIHRHVTIKYTDEDGKEKTINERLNLPADLASAIVSTLLVHIGPKAPRTIVSILVATSCRIVTHMLQIKNRISGLLLETGVAQPASSCGEVVPAAARARSARLMSGTAASPRARDDACEVLGCARCDFRAALVGSANYGTRTLPAECA